MNSNGDIGDKSTINSALKNSINLKKIAQNIKY